MTEREPEELDEREAEPQAEPGFAPAAEGRPKLDADYLLDKVIPGEIDWRDMVRRHPLLAVGAAAGIGFLLGRARGSAIVAGVSAAVTTAVMRQLSDVFEGEVFEF
ncbi:MAG: hypothetical protein AB2L07_16560 [Thermoanaerobaculaceae bacterium]